MIERRSIESTGSDDCHYPVKTGYTSACINDGGHDDQSSNKQGRKEELAMVTRSLNPRSYTANYETQ